MGRQIAIDWSNSSLELSSGDERGEPGAYKLLATYP